ncbi:hypothetical protein OF83DRAFT_1116636 [Amylostereum chailletii]|nr:hypothetical protein OF83DRAFT_1116636 [Amylostereum chailletii]
MARASKSTLGVLVWMVSSLESIELFTRGLRFYTLHQGIAYLRDWMFKVVQDLGDKDIPSQDVLKLASRLQLSLFTAQPHLYYLLRVLLFRLARPWR